MFRWLLTLLLIVSASLGVVIGLFNPQTAEFDLVLWSWQAPLGALVLAALVTGVVIGLLVFGLAFAAPARWSRWRGKRRTARQ